MAAASDVSHAEDIFDALMEVVKNPITEEELSHDSVEEISTLSSSAVETSALSSSAVVVTTKAQSRKEKLMREKQAKSVNRLIDVWAARKKVDKKSTLLTRIKDGVLQHPEFDNVVENPQNQTLLTRIIEDVGLTITQDIESFTQNDLDDLGKFNGRAYTLPTTEIKRSTRIQL